MRSAVYEDEFEKDRERIEPEFERFDDLIQGLEKKLLTKPEFGTPIDSDKTVWFVPSTDVFKTPYVIYYAFNDQKVYFLRMIEADSSAWDVPF